MSTKPNGRMTRETAWQYVTDAHTGIVTSLRADGVPISTPVWFAVLDRVIYFNTRGKKLARIRRDPRVGFLVESGDDWLELRAVHITGRAEVLEPDRALEAAIDAELDRKYAKHRVDPDILPPPIREAVYSPAARRYVRLTPDDRVLSWDNDNLGIPRPDRED
jgi:nitroimidazol reductase NimA-like FMN-containing flavoprotein (pyridoxamine 5'-phosphate oxidase superfamily)